MSRLFDTTILVDYFRERQQAVDLIEGSTGKPTISVCTIMELIADAPDRREERRIERLPAILSVLPVTTQIAQIAGQHVKHYQKSHGLDDLDAVIAATAEHHGLALVTLNLKHFPMFPKLKAPY